jgi:hypothetical protein
MILIVGNSITDWSSYWGYYEEDEGVGYCTETGSTRYQDVTDGNAGVSWYHSEPGIVYILIMLAPINS